ncbi:LacI family DNA-binding transcriptional regulator [Leifsonia sp. McL0607]|uniref:LacI family DNA-binding transcriptional regulator n=1 Tax=Leifsonia sp. McL0607 TaxID=3415672 RepID=UPI003CF29A47
MGFVRVADVAVRAGVSPGTVSNFFHNPARVAEATAERIRSAIDELGYVPNDAARALRRRETKALGHLAFEVANPYSAEFVKAVDREARALGYTMLNVSSEGDVRLQTELLETFARQRVDGVLLSPIGDVTAAAHALSRHEIPLVLTDSVDRIAASVSYDDERGGQLAAAHLLELGHRRLLFVGHSPGNGIVERRLTGARDVVANDPSATLDVTSFDVRSIANGRRVGEQIAAMSPNERPTGVIAVNDLVAVGVLNGVYHRVSVPGDLAIIGFDDIEFASQAVVPLSSIARPIDVFAHQAVAMLHERVREGIVADDSPILFLEPRLVVRESTSPSPRS